MNLAWSGPFTPEEERLLARIRNGIDQPRLHSIVRGHVGTGFGQHKRRYLDLMSYLGVVFEDSVRLGLHRSPRLRILDVGTGPGAFAHVLERLGHEVVATERAHDESVMWSRWHPEDRFDGASRGRSEVPPMDPDTSMYEELADLLGIVRVIWTVEAHTSAPDLGRPFDLICARSLYFDRNRGGEGLWDLDAWRFFLSDVNARLLRPEGRLFMSFPGAFPERARLVAALKEAGALVSNRRVVLDRDTCRTFVGAA